MNWIIFTPKQNLQTLQWNDMTDYKVRPRLIDREAHDLLGSYAAPDSVVTGEYAEFWTDRLADHQLLTAAPDDLFAPVSD